jgi:ATP-dependent RNA helicase RhlE
VVNYDLPDEPESYVHRIGRTARAGAEGKAISFCDTEERDKLRDIERLIRKSIPVNSNYAFALQVYSQRQYNPNAPRPQQGSQRSPAQAHAPRAPHAHAQGTQAHSYTAQGQRTHSSANGQRQHPQPQHGRHRGAAQGQSHPRQGALGPRSSGHRSGQVASRS